MFIRAHWGLSAFALCALLAGCGVSERVARRTAQHTYRAPCDAVAPAVREALRDRGYDPQSAWGDGALLLSTEWRTHDPPLKTTSIATRYRYVASLAATGGGACRLRVQREASGAFAPSSERDLEVEWDVLQQVDPARARRIRAGESNDE